MSVNKTILVGNLGCDPEARYTPTGKLVVNFRMATTESWKDSTGNKQEHTEWHRIVVWGKLGEICQKFLKKGRQVYIEGRIRTRSFEDKEGVQRSLKEIIANNIVLLRDGNGNGKNGNGHSEDVPPNTDEPVYEPDPAEEFVAEGRKALGLS